jgi:hypothetical protein
VPDPTAASRRLRLDAIRRRVANDRGDDTSMPVLDRRWLLGEVDRLQRELAEEETDKAEVVDREESMRLDAEEQLRQAERTIRELRDQIDYWKMGQ